MRMIQILHICFLNLSLSHHEVSRAAPILLRKEGKEHRIEHAMQID